MSVTTIKLDKFTFEKKFFSKLFACYTVHTLQERILHYSAVQYSVEQYSSVQYWRLQYSAVQESPIPVLEPPEWHQCFSTRSRSRNTVVLPHKRMNILSVQFLYRYHLIYGPYKFQTV
jgi:hypothetical protein